MVRTGTICAILGLAALFSLATGAALAHEGAGAVGGFVSGFTHPILGPDHLLAMLAVGLWGAQMGGRSIWVLPVVFPLVMAVGGAMGIVGIPLPSVEIAIALSVIGLGGAIALALVPLEWIAAAAVGIFAIFHGHAHGAELPSAANPATYAFGFVLATGLIHLAGVGIGFAAGTSLRAWPGRAVGAAISLTGIYFLVG